MKKIITSLFVTLALICVSQTVFACENCDCPKDCQCGCQEKKECVCDKKCNCGKKCECENCKCKKCGKKFRIFKRKCKCNQD